MGVKWVYENGGFAIRSTPGLQIAVFNVDSDRVCLMCGNVVPVDFRTVHRAGCVLPKPFDVREYARILNVTLENITPLENPLEAAAQL